MRKLRSIILYTLLIVGNINNVRGQGIEFITNLTWANVKKEAQLSDKYIFLDCYATWCVPCKAMDQYVYTNKNLGEFFNSKFICTKIQMDRTPNDSEMVKNNYEDALNIQNLFHVDAFPTLLFFNSDGNIIYRLAGYKSSDDLMDIGKSVLSEGSRVTKSIREYKSKQLPLRNFAELAIINKNLGNKTLADSIANDYRNELLDKISTDSMFMKVHLDFIIEFNNLIHINDRWFKFFYENPKQVDSILESPGYTNRLIKYVLDKDIIAPELTESAIKNDTPRWSYLINKISVEYSRSLALSTVLPVRTKWLIDHLKYNEAAKNYLRELSIFGLDTSSTLSMADANNTFWYTFFKKVDKRSILKRSLPWLEMILTSEPLDYQRRDTYASILYKIGRKKLAINQEKIALETIKNVNTVSPEIVKEDLELFKNIIRKMEANERIWDEQ